MYGPSKVFSSSLALSSSEASLCRREAGDKEKLARGARWDGEREAFRLSDHRPFRLHSAPVSKHKKMRSRLGWTISYKSLYFVYPSPPQLDAFVYRNAGKVYRYIFMGIPGGRERPQYNITSPDTRYLM